MRELCLPQHRSTPPLLFAGKSEEQAGPNLSRLALHLQEEWDPAANAHLGMDHHCAPERQEGLVEQRHLQDRAAAQVASDDPRTLKGQRLPLQCWQSSLPL